MITIIKTIHNNETSFIKDIVNKFNILIKEFYNVEYLKDRKKAVPIQTRMGTKNYPLVVFYDENQVEIKAIWPESNPNWEKEIIKTLEDNGNNIR